MKSRLNHPVRVGMQHYSKLALFVIAIWLGLFIVGILVQCSAAA